MKNTLKRLTLRNFKSVVGEIDIPLPAAGMALLEGRNRNTGGSSGAGKSLVLTALNMALGCSSHPMTKAQSWYTDLKPEIILEWDNDKHGACFLFRGKRSLLRLGTVEYTAAGTITEKLREVFGVDPALMKILTYNPQQDFNDFISKDNAEKQEFLATILDLHPYEAAVDAATDTLKTLATDETAKAERVKIFEAQVESAQKLLDEAKASYVFEDPGQKQVEIQSHAHTKDNWHRDYSEFETKLRLLNQNERPKKLKEAQSRFLAASADADQSVAHCKQKLFDVQNELQPPTEAEVTTAARIKIGQQKLVEVQTSDAVKHDAFLKQCQELDTKIATVRTHSRTVAQLETQVKMNTREIGEREAAIKKLEQNLCPTCGQQWQDAVTKIEEHRTNIKALTAGAVDMQVKLVELNEELKKLPQLQAERAAMKFTPDPLIDRIRGGIAQLEAQLRSFQQARVDERRVKLEAAAKEVSIAEEEVWEIEQKVKAAEAEVEAELRKAQDEIQQALLNIRQNIETETVAISKLKAEVALIEERNRGGATRVQAAELNLKTTQTAYDRAVSELVTVQVKANVEREFIRITGREGFLGRIFDEVLAEISTETNAILARVANTAHVTIQFQSEFQNNKGATEKKIRTRAFVSGNETECNETGISGGMLSAVRLAVKIAIRHVVFRRAGIHLGWSCLDESFDGLDPVSKEACFEILNEEARDSLVLVVDHSPEFKSMFSQRIILDYKDGVTTLGKEAA